MPKYERDNDSIEATLKETHETVGRLNALIDDLTSQIKSLKAETGPQKGAQ
jgi:septal ring factor EnvC (AmiA/AmiB activator)